MSPVRARVGRDNPTVLRLTIDNETVPQSAVTRAVFRFGDWCLDTSEPGDPIELIDSATRVQMRLGLVQDIAPGIYPGRLTVFDAQSANGIAWGESVIHVIVEDWPTCG